jgi:hypothetical protein
MPTPKLLKKLVYLILSFIKMKTLPLFIGNNFKVLLLLGLLLHVQSSEVYAQDQELFEHNWYFSEGMLDSEGLIPINSSLQIVLCFFENSLEMSIPYCEDGYVGEDMEVEENQLVFSFFDWSLVGLCLEDDYDYIEKHYTIYAVNDETGSPKNPFIYAIETIDDYYQLTIENGEGDWAVYNSVLLSTTYFSKDSFTLYPNPAKETLNINSNSNQQVTAIIYDLNGKLIQSHSFESERTTLDVRSFNQGLYFIVFETETGEWVSKKFVKK